MSLKNAVDLLKSHCDVPTFERPGDIEPFNYRWYRIFYTQIKLRPCVELSEDMRKSFYTVSRVLRDEHLLCWSRARMYPVVRTHADYRSFLFHEMQKSSNLDQMRIILNAFRMAEHEDYFLDDHCLEFMPSLAAYIEGPDADKWNLLKLQQKMESI